MVFCLYIAIFCSPFTSVVFVQLILYEREHIQTNTILRVCIVKIIHGKVSWICQMLQKNLRNGCVISPEWSDLA